MTIYDWLWYRAPKYLAFPLLAFSLLYYLGLRVRYLLDKRRPCHPLSVPVIVVGNVTVGGTGKTPLVIHLVQWLQQRGTRVGVISRGYRGTAGHQHAVMVDDSSSFHSVGDEPKLIYQETACFVAVAKELYKAAKLLIDEHQVEVIISDDGLQHSALERTIEIITIDGSRAFGNGWLLPAGPLREPVARIESADLIVVNGTPSDKNCLNPPHPNTHYMQMSATAFYAPAYDKRVTADYFKGQRVHACAALANPERFFDTLGALGMEVEAHVFRDHHAYRAKDFHFDESLPVVMTAKDGVKWLELSEQGNRIEANSWILETQLQIDPSFEECLLTKLGYHDDNR